MELNNESCVEGGDVVADAAGATAVEGDRGVVLREFLVTNYDRLHRRLLRHLRCPDLASESLHDAWLQLGNRRVCAQIQSPEAYVYRVARNQAVDRLRADRSWQYTGDADTELEYIVDAAPGPATIAEARSDLVAVVDALGRLPYRHQAVLVALRVEEQTRQEVAAFHRLSMRSVDKMLRQALDQCAEGTGQTVTAGVSASRCASPPRWRHKAVANGAAISSVL